MKARRVEKGRKIVERVNEDFTRFVKKSSDDIYVMQYKSKLKVTMQGHISFTER
jgi:hypothetical protein